MKSDISVIMAVYNAEAFLKRSIDSLLSQSFRNFDVIFVDDGSTDNTLAIANEYARSDKRIRVYHKENGGVSSARQYGMERLLEYGGEYSIHLDPDDWVEPDMLEKLYKKAIETSADMVICDYYVNFDNKQKLFQQDPQSEIPSDIIQALFQRLHGSLWNKLIKSVCYKDANIKFPKGLNYCEDLYVNLCLLQHIKKVSYLPCAFYHYNRIPNPQSETQSVDSKKIDFTRTEIVRQCQNILSNDMRKGDYYYFVIQKAFDIINHGKMKHAEFHDFFKDIPLSLLVNKRNNYFQILFSYLSIHSFFIFYTYRLYRHILHWGKKMLIAIQ